MYMYYLKAVFINKKNHEFQNANKKGVLRHVHEIQCAVWKIAHFFFMKVIQ